MEIDLVVFDMAGTTVNDEDSVNRCLRASLAAAGLLVTAAQVNAVMGLPKPTAIAMLIEQLRPGECAATPGRRHSRRLRRHDRSSFSRTTRRFMKSRVRRAFLKSLKKSAIRVALDTGFNRAIAQVILDRLGWSASAADRCDHLQRRGQPRAASSGYDSRPHGPLRDRRSAARGQGRRYAGRPPGRSKRGLRAGRRRHRRNAWTRRARAVSSLPI